MKYIVLQMDDCVEYPVEAESGYAALNQIREALGGACNISEVEGIEGTVGMYCDGKTYVTDI